MGMGGAAKMAVNGHARTLKLVGGEVRTRTRTRITGDGDGRASGRVGGWTSERVDSITEFANKRKQSEAKETKTERKWRERNAYIQSRDDAARNARIERVRVCGSGSGKGREAKRKGSAEQRSNAKHR